MGVRNLSFYLILMAGAAYIATQGLDLWDSGYIIGYSWRMAEGALPYKDFFYKGPPATLFLWSIGVKVLPVWGQYYFLKLINWLLFGWQTQLWLAGIERGLAWKIPNRNLIGWIGVVFSVQFFPMYPWPTTDGLLYSAIMRSSCGGTGLCSPNAWWKLRLMPLNRDIKVRSEVCGLGVARGVISELLIKSTKSIILLILSTK